jgi:septum site-determining protein MinC
MSDDLPGSALFATETMAELSARQGRVADAIAIYRHMLRGAAQRASTDDENGVDHERAERWRARLLQLEQGQGQGAPQRPASEPRSGGSFDAALAPAAAPGGPPESPASRPSLVIHEPVRSGQVVYADGRDLIVVAPVHPGAQLLADGNIHVYGTLAGRAIAGAQGRRAAQVFCLNLEAELVGVDTGYLLSDDFPAAARGAPSRAYLTASGACAIEPLPQRKPRAATAAVRTRRWF